MINLLGECEKGLQCKQKWECPDFKEKETKLETLTILSTEWLQLISKLKDLKCNGENDWICCETEKIKGGFDDVTGMRFLYPSTGTDVKGETILGQFSSMQNIVIFVHILGNVL